MLEQIVRPNQSISILSTRALVVDRSAREPVPVARLVWGEAGNLPSEQQQEGPDVKDQKKTKFTHKEIERTTQTVRVKNPDDPDQYVDVKRITKIKFKKDEGPVTTVHSTSSGPNVPAPPGPSGDWSPAPQLPASKPESNAYELSIHVDKTETVIKTGTESSPLGVGGGTPLVVGP